MSIYIANISYKVTEAELKKVFETVGQVKSTRILTDKESGKSRGVGFVEMENDSDAEQAIEQLNGYKLEGRELVVQVAKPRKSSTSGY